MILQIQNDQDEVYLFTIIILLMKQRKPSAPQHDFNLRFAQQQDKQYDALKDPHANYYFVSTAAKERLKDLKREIKRERNNTSIKEKEMLKLIKDKIKFKFPKIKLPILPKKDTQVLTQRSRHQSFENVTIKDMPIYNKLRPQRSDLKKSITSLSKGQLLNQTSLNHNQFIQFLAQTKNKLKEQA